MEINFNKAISALDIWDLLKWLFGLVVFVVGFITIFWRSIKVFFRLGRNLGGKVFIFCPSGGKRSDGSDKDMKRELGVLKSSGFFDVSNNIITDFHSIEPKDIEGAGIVVLGYHNGMKYFAKFVDMVKTANRPLVVYTFELGNSLDGKHREELKDYKWYTLSSMPLRLVGDLFAIMASYKYDKERS